MTFRNVWNAPLCEMSIRDAIAHFAVGHLGHVVPLWEDQHAEQEQWCRDTISRRWVSARTLVTPDQLNDELEARFSQGNLGPSVKPLAAESVVMKAGTRKLSAKWSVDFSQTLTAEHNIDVEQDIMDALAAEITAEIDQEFLRAFAAQPGTSSDVRKRLRRAQAVWHFAFADARDATLFKLTWGGDEN